jgi:hypothetical protein
MKTVVSDDTVTVSEVCGCRASTRRFEPCAVHDLRGGGEISTNYYRNWRQRFKEAATEAQQRHNRKRLHSVIFKDHQ